MTSLSETAADLIRTDPALANEVARQLAPTPIVGLTDRQAEVYRFLCGYFAEHRKIPNYDQIAAGVGLSSKGRIGAILDELALRGCIKRIPGHTRAITILGVAA